MAQETDPQRVFEILERMGEGSYGSVWKARHKKSDKIVAVKIIPADTDLVDLMKEITILKECRSDFIIRYYGSYYKEGDLWIVMEFGDCGSLADSINKEAGVFSEKEIQYLLASILLGIAYLHSHKKIHRDIKAGNVLLTKDGKAKLADFGVSAKLDTTLSKRNTVIGTPFWMAPEIIQEISYDGKADIWSLGITAIELAEGAPPYSNIHPMRAVFMIPNRPAPRLRTGDKWSKTYADFVAACLEKDPDRRPTAKELLDHPFVHDAAIELEANKGHSEVLKNMVDRLMIRRAEIAKQRKSLNSSSGADFGNTIISVESSQEPTGTVKLHNVNDGSSTIVINHDNNSNSLIASQGNEPRPLPIPRDHPIDKPAYHPYHLPSAGGRRYPLPVTGVAPSVSSVPIAGASGVPSVAGVPGVPGVPGVTSVAGAPSLSSLSSVSSISSPPITHGIPGAYVAPITRGVPSPITGLPSLSASNQSSTDREKRSPCFVSNSSLYNIPATHLQRSLDNNIRQKSEMQQAVIAMMPALPSHQPVQRSKAGEWMRLRRRGDELKNQLASDFQILYDTYFAEINKISEAMKEMEENGC